jgi:hypothetical protein
MHITTTMWIKEWINVMGCCIKDGTFNRLVPQCNRMLKYNIIDWACLRTGCWREYLVRSGMKWQKVGENCIIRNFITCTLCQIWLRSQGGLDGQSMGDKRNIYRILVGKPYGKRLLGKPICWWKDNTKMNLWEIGWSGIDWIDLTQDMEQWRDLVNTVMNLRVP